MSERFKEADKLIEKINYQAEIIKYLNENNIPLISNVIAYLSLEEVKILVESKNK